MHKHPNVLGDDPQFLAQRYGLFWHHIDQAFQTPPSLSKQARYTMTLPWSGNGGFTQVVHAGADNVARVWFEPWNSTAPVHMFVGAPGTQMVGPNNAAPVPEPDGELSLAGAAPWVGANLTQYGYHNVNMAASGFANNGIGFFLGGFMEVEAYVDQDSRGSAVVIGQHEVRGVGIGPLETENIHRARGTIPFDWADDAAATDYSVNPLLHVLGAGQEFKKPKVLVIENQNQNQKLFVSIPVVPGKFGPISMQANQTQAGTGSIFMVDAGRMLMYTPNDYYCGEVVQPDPPDIDQNIIDFGVGIARVVRWVSAGPPDDTVRVATDPKKRLNRATTSAYQSLKAGYPFIEFTCTKGTLTLDIRFKMFYQLNVPITHPSYELASFGNYTDEDEVAEYQIYSCPVPGLSLESRDMAIVEMKQGAVARAIALHKESKPHLMYVLRQIHASAHAIPATIGINEVQTEDDPWIEHVLRYSKLDVPPTKRYRRESSLALPTSAGSAYSGGSIYSGKI